MQDNELLCAQHHRRACHQHHSLNLWEKIQNHTLCLHSKMNTFLFVRLIVELKTSSPSVRHPPITKVLIHIPEGAKSHLIFA
uniref:Uncharacterized protein n=1 Tax=Arundo donax TaxID=35708 RepID=A0A0A9D848_ARUDO